MSQESSEGSGTPGKAEADSDVSTSSDEAGFDDVLDEALHAGIGSWEGPNDDDEEDDDSDWGYESGDTDRALEMLRKTFPGKLGELLPQLEEYVVRLAQLAESADAAARVLPLEDGPRDALFKKVDKVLKDVASRLELITGFDDDFPEYDRKGRPKRKHYDREPDVLVPMTDEQLQVVRRFHLIDVAVRKHGLVYGMPGFKISEPKIHRLFRWAAQVRPADAKPWLTLFRSRNLDVLRPKFTYAMPTPIPRASPHQQKTDFIRKVEQGKAKHWGIPDSVYLDDDDFVDLAPYLSQAETLDISRAYNLTEVAYNALAQHCRKLTEFRASLGATDQCLVLVLTANPNIRVVQANGNDKVGAVVSDAILSFIGHACPDARELQFVDAWQVTSEGCKLLKLRNNRVRITTGDSGSKYPFGYGDAYSDTW